MSNLLYLYQHIPYNLNPVAFAVGNFAVDWYSIMYLVAFGVVYSLLKYRIKRSEGDGLEITKSKLQISNKILASTSGDSCSSTRGGQNPKSEINIEKIPNTRNQIQNTDTLLDIMLAVFVGLLIGGRLGYVIFYNFTYYLQNPLVIISPYDAVTHQFIGIYGMSYHGGLIGAVLAGWIFIRIKRLDFWRWANFVAPAVPAGYFFGRIGNFLNGELYGRATSGFWGMYFPSDPFGLLRHPSELYEAVLEGLIIFLVLWPLRHNQKYQDKLLALYIVGYASARIIAEFFREPDVQVGYIFNSLTLGQILSSLMLVFGLWLIFVSRKRKKVV
ncbi:MAG: prolipoprotein diacylglyceryl transferase [Parcubacteria group bacterium]